MIKLWASKRFSTYLLTLVAVTVLAALGVTGVVDQLAYGLAAALPVLLGAESWVDVARTRTSPPTPFPRPVQPAPWAPPPARAPLYVEPEAWADAEPLPDPVVPPVHTRPRRTP